MRGAFIFIILILVIINIVCYIIGKRKMKSMDAEDADFKVGIKYMYFSIILAMITLLITTIIAILNIFAK